MIARVTTDLLFLADKQAADALPATRRSQVSSQTPNVNRTRLRRQPSLQFTFAPGGVGATPLVTVRRRLERDDLTVMASRFEGDRFCKAQRFAAYSEALGDRFIARVLPDSAANPTVRRFSNKWWRARTAW